jgi:hypothetical protein
MCVVGWHSGGVGTRVWEWAGVMLVRVVYLQVWVGVSYILTGMGGCIYLKVWVVVMYLLASMGCCEVYDCKYGLALVIFLQVLADVYT